MVLFLALFIFLFFVVLLVVGFGLAFLKSRQKEQIRAMLRRASSGGRKLQPDLLMLDEEHDALSSFLNRQPAFVSLNALMEQAGLQWTAAKFVLLSLVFGMLGFLLGYLFLPAIIPRPTTLAIALLTASFPLLNVLRKRKKKLAKFEEQLPEALDFLARSMRAGHAFSISLEMLVADSPEPLQASFRVVVNDMHLGSGLDVALGKLAALVPLIDVRFFVSAVILQQGTGGNLSEVMNSMSGIMRERVQLKGQVRALSAHGKITGLVLAIMPIVVGALLFLVSPEYLMVLFVDPAGRKLLYAAGFGQLLGYLTIRKIVNIKV